MGRLVRAGRAAAVSGFGPVPGSFRDLSFDSFVTWRIASSSAKTSWGTSAVSADWLGRSFTTLRRSSSASTTAGFANAALAAIGADLAGDAADAAAAGADLAGAMAEVAAGGADLAGDTTEFATAGGDLAGPTAEVPAGVDFVGVAVDGGAAGADLPGDAAEVSAPIDKVATSSWVIARNSRRRSPSNTPIFSRSWSVSSGRTSGAIAFSRNAAS